VEKVTRERWDLAIEQEDIEWNGDLVNDPSGIGGKHGQIVCHAKYFQLFEEYADPNEKENTFKYDIPIFDLKGKSIVDIAGGPHSMLLRCKNFSRAYVVDPGDFPEWIHAQYQERGITLISLPAEEFKYPDEIDEVWMYNALTHFYDPECVLRSAVKNSKCLRICEPVGTPTNINHPQTLYAEEIEKTIGQKGNTKNMLEPAPSPRGVYFYGVFNFTNDGN